MVRPFFRSSIGQLEDALAEKRSDKRFLSELLEELKHRDTVRASNLKAAVEARLAALATVVEPPSRSDLPIPSENKPATPAKSTSTPRPTENRPPPPRPVPPNAATEERPAASLGPLPPITNAAPQVLSAWTALEVLAPPTFFRPEDLAGGDPKAVASLEGPALPWERGEKSRPNYRLYYQVVLGAMKLEPAVERLIQRFGDSRPERPGVRGQAALGVVIVDQQGRPVQSPAVAVASVGWGVVTALRGQLTDLARWPQVEADLVERVEKRLLGTTLNTHEAKEAARAKPLTRAALTAAYEQLLAETGLPGELVEPPRFAIRSYEYFKNPGPPDALLLNSFFLADLAWARALCTAGKAPANLQRYLGITPPRSQRDLLRSEAALEEAVAPAVTPLARWPGFGRHPLALLQQAAVNLAFQETRAGGLLGVNGPPGTGKTTLLRDMVAGVLTARAEAMAAFRDPQEAFRHSGEKIKAGNGWLHLYRLDPALRGFEMVVASSNNKAVENVSAELPGEGAIAQDATSLRYFKTLSDELHGRSTWGLIAAVLGNLGNRGRFKQTFWWDEDFGMNAYLAAAAGSPGRIEERNPGTGRSEYRLPKIVQREVPPTSQEDALARWQRARTAFQAALEKSRSWRQGLEILRGDLAKLPELEAAIRVARQEHEAAIQAEQAATAAKQRGELARTEAHRRWQEAEHHAVTHGQNRPGFWARLFGTRKAQEWSQRARVLRTASEQAASDLRSKEQAGRDTEENLRRVRDATQQTNARRQTANEAHARVKGRLAEAQRRLGVTFADHAFFAQEHGRKHLSLPWYTAEGQRLRDDLFAAAVALHRAFIDAAAKPLRHNLGALMNLWSGPPPPGASKEALLPDLWSSLFLVVPLVSTTFASVSRMLGKLPAESLGWLFVDEAGQALPQAAVGALLRCRRAVVVGDPAQIEPVVTLPETLTQAVCRRFGVEPDRFNAPAASVQTLADAASAHASEFRAGAGSRPVGVPLLVHRRCEEPMFGVSNEIAYAGLMVPAKQPKPSRIREVLGPSAWFDVEGGGAEDKWSAAEGAMVVRLLRRLADAQVPPNLYVVSPFVIVADRLRQIIRGDEALKSWIVGDAWRWTAERVGTVHTVQGREAEAVFFVLGAPMPAQTGARGWAGARPNLLNVAVTRAQEVLYVVGNRGLWREAGLFRALDRRLPKSP